MIVLDRLPGFSAFLLVGLMEIRTVVSDFWASVDRLFGLYYGIAEKQKFVKPRARVVEWYTLQVHGLKVDWEMVCFCFCCEHV